MATTLDSHAGGLGFESRCRPTKVWSPNTPIPRLQVAKMRQRSLPKKGAMWDGVHRRPSTRDEKIIINIPWIGGGRNGSVVKHRTSNPKVQLPARRVFGKENPGKKSAHIPGAKKRKTLKNLFFWWNSLQRVMWHHLTYKVASGSVSPWKTGGMGNRLMKPRPTTRSRVAFSDAREYKISIRRGIWRASGPSLMLKCASVRSPMNRSSATSSGWTDCGNRSRVKA